MIRRIVSFALHQPLVILFATALFVAGGLIAFKNLPVEAFPDVTDTQVTVITLFPGRAAEEVEKQVTIPLEVALSGLPNAVRLFSHTQFGLSFLILTFDDDANVNLARQQVGERLRSVQLPPGVAPDIAPLSTAIGEIYRYRMKSETQDSRTLRTLQDWVVERTLRRVPGVADIVPMGGLIKQYEVQPDLARLRAYKLSIQQVYGALERGNSNAGGGYVEQGGQQYTIRGIGLLRDAADIENIVLGERNGTPIMIRDVARVVVGNVPRQGIVGQDLDDDVVTGVVLMRKGENPSKVLKEVKQKVDELNRGGLPKGVAIVPFYDRSWLIGKTLNTVFKNLFEGAALVAIVLYLFLANFRAAAIVTLIIPLSLLSTFLGLTFVGIPANLLSLGAMDFGIIVDGAVIVVENVVRRLSMQEEFHDATVDKREDRFRMRTIIEAAVEVGRPTLFAMIIIIAAHIPIFTLQRHEGRIFAPMAYSVTFALLGSLILSLTLVPLLCYKWLSKNLPHHDPAIVRFSKAAYAPVLKWSLANPIKVIGLALLALGLSFAALPRLGTEFLPELNEGSLWLNVKLPSSVSVSEAQAQNGQIRRILMKTPEVNTVISKAGRPEDGTDPKLINMAEFLVDLKPESEWKRAISKRQVMDEMEKALLALPAIKPSFSQPIRDNILESISQIDGQIVIKVFGDDIPTLRRVAESVLAAVGDVEGVARALIDRVGELPNYLVEIDRARAARYGLNVADIQEVIEVGLGGRAATYLWEGERKFGVAVRVSPEERGLERMKSVMLATSSGAYVPLSEVAAFKAAGGSMNIARENGGRVMAIGIFIRDRDMGSVVADMQARVRDKVKLPEGYRISWAGEFENQERAMARLALVVPISVLLIFVLLFNAFNSIKSAVLIILNVPFALIGGIFALLLTDINLSVSAAIGFIALFGQAVLNGVVMVTVFNQLRSAGMAPTQAVLEGSMQRLRTVLMTGLLAMLGLLPMALSTDIGSETQKPLAVVVIGGLISATLLTLVVLPVLYVAFNRDWTRFARRGSMMAQRVLRPRKR